MKNILSCGLFLSFIFPVKAQLINDSIQIEGHYRAFHFNKPSQSFRQPNLIFVLHGSGGNGLGMMTAATKMEKQASTQNTLVVYPDGYQRYWNECRKSQNETVMAGRGVNFPVTQPCSSAELQMHDCTKVCTVHTLGLRM
ncbi:hypothetical protein EON64_12180 [archaeon]|nr:MAG: hypothetical protein EON64_12180 [archaeon]